MSFSKEESHYCYHEDQSTADHFHDIQTTEYQYQQLLQQNVRLRQQIQRKRQHQVIQHRPKQITDLKGDIELWGIVKRNDFLENKVEQLKTQYCRQSNTINQMRSSEKWKSRLQCKSPTSQCYESKYLKLLRLQSPLY